MRTFHMISSYHGWQKGRKHINDHPDGKKDGKKSKKAQPDFFALCHSFFIKFTETGIEILSIYQFLCFTFIKK